MTPTNAKHKFIYDLVERQHDLFANNSKAVGQKKLRAIEEMYDLCDNAEQRSCVKDMIMDFAEMNDDIYNLSLLDNIKIIKITSPPLSKVTSVPLLVSG